MGIITINIIMHDWILISKCQNTVKYASYQQHEGIFKKLKEINS